MATKFFLADETASGGGAVVDLANTYSNAFVAGGITIASPNNGGIVGGLDDYSVVVEGTILADLVGISLLDIPNGHGTEEAIIHQGGRVLSTNSSAVLLFGDEVNLDNAGTLESYGASAVRIGAQGATGVATINNSNKIVAYDASSVAITRADSSELGTVVLNNSGTVIGGAQSYDARIATGPAVDQITNSGKMVGAIFTGGGNDTVDTSKGTVQGNIDLGGGNDIASGSAASDRIYGRGGNDSIIAGHGGDVITGGSGRDIMAGNTKSTLDDGARDIFKFTATSDSGTTSTTRDTIYGFFNGGASGGDKIDLSGLATGGPSSSFHFVGTAAFTSNHPAEVRVIASGADYIVQINNDNDSAADMTILVHSNSHTFVAGDFVL